MSCCGRAPNETSRAEGRNSRFATLLHPGNCEFADEPCRVGRELRQAAGCSVAHCCRSGCVGADRAHIAQTGSAFGQNQSIRAIVAQITTRRRRAGHAATVSGRPDRWWGEWSAVGSAVPGEGQRLRSAARRSRVVISTANGDRRAGCGRGNPRCEGRASPKDRSRFTARVSFDTGFAAPETETSMGDQTRCTGSLNTSTATETIAGEGEARQRTRAVRRPYMNVATPRARRVAIVMDRPREG
jgi:hypothetical protein